MNDKMRVGFPQRTLQLGTHAEILGKLGDPMYHDWGIGWDKYASYTDRYHDKNFTPTVWRLGDETKRYLSEPHRWGRGLFFGNEPERRERLAELYGAVPGGDGHHSPLPGSCRSGKNPGAVRGSPPG